jgi:DNA repair protein RecN (Recombination protein N)
MLQTIKLKNFFSFKKAQANFSKGLTVISGESGSGKSTLLEGLFWCLGLSNRGDTDSLVELVFTAKEDLVIKRQGKNFYLNEKKVTKTAIEAVTKDLIIFAKQESRINFSTKENLLAIVDKFLPAKDKIKELYKKIKELEKKQAELESLNPEEKDYLEMTVSELSKLELQGNDETEIVLEKRRQIALYKKEEEIEKALDIFNKKAIISGLIALSRALEGEESLLELQKRSDSLLEEARDIEALLLSQKSSQTRENLLDQLEEKLIKIRSLAKKYRSHPDQLLNFYDKIKEKLVKIEEIDLEKDKIAKNLKKITEEFLLEAENLNQLREPIIAKINQAIKENLKDLLMEGIKVQLQLEEASFSESGNRILLLKIGEGGKRNLSGGEISRLLLAIKIATSDLDKIMVFDEIDLGIGGATAHQVGKKLAQLGKLGQVIVITHQPQVAAYGNHHLLVDKNLDDSSLKILSKEEKIEEIARMISGDLITEESRKAGEKLLEAAI